jgi:transposase
MVAELVDYVRASTRTETSTRSPSSRRRAGQWLRRGRSRATAAATRRRCASRNSRPALAASGRSRARVIRGLDLPAICASGARRCWRWARSPRAERRLSGKDDRLDAIRAARAALTSEPLPRPRSGERPQALRLLLLARRSAVDVRREALVQPRSVIVTAPDRLRGELRGLPLGRLLERCRRLRRLRTAGPDELATRLVLRSLARRIEAATDEAAELEGEILAQVRALAPGLLEEPGVGPIVAAQLLVAWSHPGRLRSEAAFARLAGVAPLPASSGQTSRHRLSRGGDRQLNRALHTVVLHRRQHDPQTRDYIARRIAEGKSRREATRLLKRYLARRLYRLLQNQEPLKA